MESFTIRLAGQYFEICPVCDYIREYCKDYIVADDAVHGIGDSATGRETPRSPTSTLSVRNPPEKISKRAFLSGIFTMHT